MTDQHALGHLRQVQLTTFEIKTLAQLALQGGEVDWFPLRVKPLTNELLDMMVKKRLVEFLTPMSRVVITSPIAVATSSVVAQNGSRIRLRLTDEGRAVNAQLEAMSMRPKIEVPTAS